MTLSSSTRGPADVKVGVVLVDHGSRRAESNDLLLEAARLFRESAQWDIVEPAHMELAEPTIAAAIDRCVAAGASRIVVFPWILSPGRHWAEDIPRLVSRAVARFPGIEATVTPPFGVHHHLIEVAALRVQAALSAGAPVRFTEDQELA